MALLALPSAVTTKNLLPQGIKGNSLAQAAQQRLAPTPTQLPFQLGTSVNNSTVPVPNAPVAPTNNLPGIQEIASGQQSGANDAVSNALSLAGQAHEQAVIDHANRILAISQGQGSDTGSGGSYTTPAVKGGLNPAQFAANLLKGLGDQVTPARVGALEAWEAQEGGNWHNDASYNPLNTTQSEPGYHEVGTQGDIGAYLNWQQGLHATLQTLENGRYSGILNALKNGASIQQVEQAISSSPWGTKF